MSDEILVAFITTLPLVERERQNRSIIPDRDRKLYQLVASQKFYLGIPDDVGIGDLPVVQVSDVKVTENASLFAEGYEIGGIKLKLRKKVKGLDVMNLEKSLVTTSRTRRVTREKMLAYGLPLA